MNAPFVHGGFRKKTEVQLGLTKDEDLTTSIYELAKVKHIQI